MGCVAYNLIESEQDSSSENEKILEEAKARFALTEEAEREIRRDALDDMRFAAGEQWDPVILQSRHNERRPALTINRMPQFIRQVTNDQRQNRPSIKVHPVDSQADVETGKIVQGIIRHIEYNSGADAAYDQSVDGAARGGFGYFRVLTDFVSHDSFDQDILIKRIRNPLSVYFDPHCKEPDGSDANFAFVTEDISKDEYKIRYPDSKLASTGEWEALGNVAPDWVTTDSARICEYFYKDYRKATIVQLSNGQVVEKSKLQEFAKREELRTGTTPDLTPVAERETQIPVIKWCKLNGCEILEKRTWAGKWIPIIPVYGEELDINGKRILKGVVRDAKDPQRMYNVWKSYETETISLAPRSPWIADAKTIENYLDIWETANTKNHPYLPFDAHPDAPPPQRQVFEPPVQAITQAAMLAADDMKATTGIYDASVGNRSNETSGVAIQRRNTQAQTSNFHFTDNLTRSQRHCGRILIDLIPHIYDTERALRIIGEDGEADTVTVNGPVMRDGQPVMGKNGKPLIYDLSVGKYDVTVDVGPSYASKRQEAAASMMDFSRSVPQVAAACADLIVKNMDWPGAQEFAERIRKTLPPNLIDDPKNKGSQIPQEAQAQMQQMGQMIDQLTGKLNELQSERQQKLLEIESKERIEFAKIEADLEIKRAELDARDGVALLNAQIKEIEGRMAQLKFYEPVQYGDDQGSVPQPAGDMSAQGGMAAPIPTGGESPGTPMEGNFQ